MALVGQRVKLKILKRKWWWQWGLQRYTQSWTCFNSLQPDKGSVQNRCSSRCSMLSISSLLKAIKKIGWSQKKCFGEHFGALRNTFFTNTSSIIFGKEAITVFMSPACRMGYHKPANEAGGCRLCPPNSRTHGEGSERCDCLQGFSRLPADPEDLGCTSKKHWVKLLKIL